MMNSPFCSEVRPGPVTIASTGAVAAAVGAGDDAGGARGDQCRDAVGCRRGVAQIAGERGAALDLLRADQIGALDDTGPGVIECFMSPQHDARRRGADDELAPSSRMPIRPGMRLMSTIASGCIRPERNCTRKIGSAGQRFCEAGAAGQHLARPRPQWSVR